MHAPCMEDIHVAATLALKFICLGLVLSTIAFALVWGAILSYINLVRTRSGKAMAVFVPLALIAYGIDSRKSYVWRIAYAHSAEATHKLKQLRRAMTLGTAASAGTRAEAARAEIAAGARLYDVLAHEARLLWRCTRAACSLRRILNDDWDEAVAAVYF
eukprot:TRINITY_DN31666_c0_g1_i1.p2 TRINITY_DN31666_c0_g1~~TRINITY_DN31666_c0_g1_i1.p2  ORF type:complete len:159 (-),score=20.89 TRINITY_DN31666_c0_g1_i1:156-632(-)